MKTLKTLQAGSQSPAVSARGNTAMRRIALVGCFILALCLPLWALSSAHASGTFWLPTHRASDPSFDHL
ncbi:MAG: hypothetical protein M3Z66_21640, partial [Chloroflexota bacterium]|nr:hypothetical protein [Chloroflexota bacterium]